MSRKRKSRSDYFEITDAFVRNGRAIEEGPKRKTWSRHDLKSIKPLTINQEEMFRAFFDKQHICAHGSPGTGKTFLAIYLALNEMLHSHSQVKRIIIVRSAVATRDMGFMPGTLEEKMSLFEAPYRDLFAQICGRPSTYQDMKDAGAVEFCTTSYVRGLTWDDSIIIVDEGQNMTFHEINSIVTRLGEGSRLIFVGDLPQTDLRKSGERTGMQKFVEIARYMKQFSVIQFTRHDIVRSAFVRDWICACEDLAAPV